ncbi:MAG: hypothetical protein Q9195_000246 [Heterodermia aff. obscurata]
MAVQSTLRSSEDRFPLLLAQWAELVRSKWTTSSKPTRLVATLSLALTIILASYSGRRWLKKQRAEKAHDQRLLRRNSGLRGKDGSRTIFVPYRSSTAKVTIYPTKTMTFDAHRRLFLNPPRAARLGERYIGHVPPPNTKPGLNVAFIHQFLSLLSIMIPHWNSKESGLLVGQGAFLLLRTYLSLVVTRLDGEIVRDLVAGNGKGFLWGIVKWLGVGGFASYTNAAIKFLQSKVSIAFRTRLTRYIHDLYLNDSLNYYKLLNLDGGIGQSVDQFVCNDLTLFTASAAALYSSIGKPLVDLCVFNYQLSRSLGPLALTGLLANYIITATALRRLSPPFGKLKAVEGRREGDFRGLHSRLIANAEEIAFYGGADMEKVFLDKGFRDLRAWMEGIYRLKIRYNMLEDFVLKYSWSAFGYLITSLPVFLPEWGGLTSSSQPPTPSTSVISPTQHRSNTRMQAFITNKRLMLSLADAGGRMMYSIKDLSELAGYTSRVYTLISTLHRVHASAYYPPRGTLPTPYSLADIQGTVHLGYEGLRFEDVPLVAPATYPHSGTPLLSTPLNFTLPPHTHTLITGPNATGKSSIARLLAGLWPPYRGLVSRPRPPSGILFLPQRPYLPLGTLRDQVIYPAREIDNQLSDTELQHILDEVHLGYLPAREGGWDARKEWKDVLSGGEKQRMGFARVGYKRPGWVVADEATSAVSADVEGLLYERCKAWGAGLVVVSTRVGLKRYCQWSLTLRGVGGGVGEGGGKGGAEEGGGEERDNDGEEEEEEVLEWDFKRIGTEEERGGVERELEGLREVLGKVAGWRKRREEIETELGRVWVVGGGDGGMEEGDGGMEEQSHPLEKPAYLDENAS